MLAAGGADPFTGPDFGASVPAGSEGQRMRITRKTFYLLVGAAVLYVAWQSYSFSAQHSGIIHTSGTSNEDRFSNVWLVEDGPFVWIRAGAKEPKWLEQVRANPDVELRHDGYSRRYFATIMDTRDARSLVTPMFRSKYGLADRLRELVVGRDAIPIRLEQQPS
jgi:hypothetical protein